MLASELTLHRFRNLAHAELDLRARFTVLAGHNGAGKTNVLEALWLCATTRSFRSAELGPLIAEGAEEARLCLRGRDPATALPTTHSTTLTRTERGIRRHTELDGRLARNATEIYGRFPAVLFVPEDLAVLRGSPSGRRQFLDRMVFALDRGHIADIQQYDKLLRTRNRLLKDPTPRSRAERDHLLAAYTEGMIELGARIGHRRRQTLVALRAPAAEAFGAIHAGIAELEPLEATLHYESELEAEQLEERAAELRVRYRAALPADLARRTTTVGPHRDDFAVRLGSRAAAGHASQGQIRALILALKVAELTLLKRRVAVAPTLLLDDVSSELDARRTEMLFSVLTPLVERCVITTTARRHIPLPADPSVQTYEVAQGQLRRP